MRGGNGRIHRIEHKEQKELTGGIRVEVSFTGKEANYLPMNQLSGGFGDNSSKWVL